MDAQRFFEILMDADMQTLTHFRDLLDSVIDYRFKEMEIDAKIKVLEYDING